MKIPIYHMEISEANGPGRRFVIWVQGCKHHCYHCFNPETHTFKTDNLIDTNSIVNMINQQQDICGVTFSGGEPMCQAEGFAALGRGIKERGKTITIYSGYTLEQLLRMAVEDKSVEELLRMCDLLIDGPFVKAKRDLTLQFRGSSNQRLIDMPKTWEEGRIVLWEG